MLGARKVAHNDQCRHRVIRSATTNADVAARVKRAIDRDEEYHAKRLEAASTKRGPGGEASPEERPAKEQRKVEAIPEAPEAFEENMSHTPSSSSQGASGSKVIKTWLTTKFQPSKVEGKASTPYW